MNKYQLLTESEKAEKAKQLLSMLSDEDLQAILQSDSLSEDLDPDTQLDVKQIDKLILMLIQELQMSAEFDDIPEPEPSPTQAQAPEPEQKTGIDQDADDIQAVRGQ